MARRIDRLSAVHLRKKPPGMHCDGRGLYLQVAADGARSWIYRFKLKKRARDMGLGSLDEVTLAEAREKAAEARRLVRQGIDPIEQRKATQASQRRSEARAMTFKECAEQLIASHEAGWRNSKHRQQWRNTLATYAYPVLGDIPVAGVTTELVLRVLEPIWPIKSETASRLRGRIEAVLSWAKAREMRTGENPALWRGHLDQLLPVPSKVRRVVHHPAMPYRKVPAFLIELRQQDGITPRALEFTVLTAARTNEVIGAKFDEFDLPAKLWRIPPERMKAEHEHRVPLCDRAVAIVKEMAAVSVNQHVFPGLKDDAALSNMAMLMLLRELHAGVTVHGFRSAFRDWAGEETDFPHDICEAALAHTRKDKTHAAYQRGDLFQKRRKLMEAWAQHCLAGAAKRRSGPQRPTDPASEIRSRATVPIPEPTLQEIAGEIG